MQIAVTQDREKEVGVRAIGTKGRKGFTLLEIMIVVAIIGLVMAMSAPSFVRMNRKEGMQRGLGDFYEACRIARANAIMSGQPTELIIHPKTREFEATGTTPFSATLPDN